MIDLGNLWRKSYHINIHKCVSLNHNNSISKKQTHNNSKEISISFEDVRLITFLNNEHSFSKSLICNIFKIVLNTKINKKKNYNNVITSKDNGNLIEIDEKDFRKRCEDEWNFPPKALTTYL
jgi:hypothetical protein